MNRNGFGRFWVSGTLTVMMLFLLQTGAAGQGPTAEDVDFDGNGTVRLGDLILFAAAYGQADPTYDLDGDGIVGFTDFLVLVAFFGTDIESPVSTPTLVTLTSPKGNVHEMAVVPGGPLLMGSDTGSENQRPARTVVVDSFLIDIFEVTNTHFASFLNAEGTASDDGTPYVNLEGRALRIAEGADGFAPASWRDADTPVVHVTWVGARAYCEWVGGRLPTEAEWEKAARGTDGRPYPWGSDPPTPALLNYNKNLREPTPVGSYPKGVSPYGIHDAAGNVFEWVADYYDPGYYAVAPDTNPTGPATGDFRVIRGGAHAAIVEAWVQTTYRQPSRETQGLVDTGFRCARTP